MRDQGGPLAWQMVKTGSSYLSQSELPLTFGLGTRDQGDRHRGHWPNGKTEKRRPATDGRPS